MEDDLGCNVSHSGDGQRRGAFIYSKVMECEVGRKSHAGDKFIIYRLICPNYNYCYFFRPVKLFRCKSPCDLICHVGYSIQRLHMYSQSRRLVLQSRRPFSAMVGFYVLLRKQPVTPCQKSSQVFRTERDTFGELKVPADRYWGAQTQRSVSISPLSHTGTHSGV